MGTDRNHTYLLYVLIYEHNGDVLSKNSDLFDCLIGTIYTKR